jgi:simple sugar transport system permease protein
LYVSGVDSRYDGLPFEVLLALPYLVIIGALALSGRNVAYPGAYLKPYRRT